MSKYNIKRNEGEEQAAVVQWAALNIGRYPELNLLYHCPNGGSRSKREGANLKRQGVKPGVSDLILPVKKGIYIGLYIEMKVNNNTCTEPQKKWLRSMREQGHFTAVCYSAQDAQEVLLCYVKLKPGEAMPIENGAILKKYA